MQAETVINKDVLNHGATILIIDDDSEILEALSAVLEIESPEFRILTAGSLDDAYAVLEKHKPDMALIDISLGTQNGLDVLPFIRKRYPDMICIMMTAHRDVEYATKAIRNGANDYLHKPLDPLAFLRVVNHYLEKQQVLRKTVEIEARYKAMFEQTFQMVFLLNKTGNILEVNETALNFRKEIRANVIGKLFWSAPWFNKTSVSVKEALEILYQQTLMGKTIRSEIRIEDINSVRRAFDISLKPVFGSGDSVQYVIAEARDVTDYRETQEKLVNLTQTLESRVVERTSEANQARIEAQHASKAKSEFLARMSHELRTPMNAVLGFSQLLDSGASGSLSDEQQEMVAEILAGGRHLLELIEEILDLSKIESGDFSIDLQDTDIVSSIKSSLSLVMPEAMKKGIKIQDLANDANYTVIADDLRLKEILINLLSNAIKYNHADGTVVIEVEPQPDGLLRVTVSDFGIGIAQEHFARVFEPFDRINQDYRTVGTGIGLAVSKQLAEKMGGTIGFISDEGKGSRFWVDIPLAESASKKASD